MKSESIFAYKRWITAATDEQLDLVDRIYQDCEKRYDQGGDAVVECMTPDDILKAFGSVEEARTYCQLKAEQATNCRWGDADDPELKAVE